MPEYHLDTSGRVVIKGAEHVMGATLGWNNLDAFTQGYIEALFFTEEERLCEESEGSRNMPAVAINMATMQSHFVGGNSFGFADLAPDSLAAIIEDCARFKAVNRKLLALACEHDGYDMTRAGSDFWFTRCGHGVGFWDRGLGDVGDKLTAACGFRNERWVELGDDGKVHVS